jgi:hypothetical protein
MNRPNRPFRVACTRSSGLLPENALFARDDCGLTSNRRVTEWTLRSSNMSTVLWWFPPMPGMHGARFGAEVGRKARQEDEVSGARRFVRRRMEPSWSSGAVRLDFNFLSRCGPQRNSETSCCLRTSPPYLLAFEFGPCFRVSAPWAVSRSHVG